MLKNHSKLEVKKGERIYQFHCDSDAPLGEIYDSLAQMSFYISGRINEVEAKKQEHANQESVEVTVE